MANLIDGLGVTCAVCNGDKTVPSEAWRVWGDAYNAAGVSNYMHVADGRCRTDYSRKDCPRCTAEREFLAEHPEPREPEDSQCGECDGSGFTLTDDGRLLFAFLVRHWRRDV